MHDLRLDFVAHLEERLGLGLGLGLGRDAALATLEGWMAAYEPSNRVSRARPGTARLIVTTSVIQPPASHDQPEA